MSLIILGMEFFFLNTFCNVILAYNAKMSLFLFFVFLNKNLTFY